MKIVSMIARYLLGIMFTVFGANGFLHFIPMPPPPPVAGQFFMAMFTSHYIVPIFALQLIGGLLLLSGFYVPLALTLLGPIVVNILLYHVTMDMPGIMPGLVAAILWGLVFVRYWKNFAGIFVKDEL